MPGEGDGGGGDGGVGAAQLLLFLFVFPRPPLSLYNDILFASIGGGRRYHERYRTVVGTSERAEVFDDAIAVARSSRIPSSLLPLSPPCALSLPCITRGSRMARGYVSAKGRLR